MKFFGAERKRNLRRLLEGRVQTVSAEEARAMRFYQFKPSTAEFFYRNLGRSDVTINDTPHFQLADALARKSNIAEAESFYVAYLAASWGKERSHEFSTRLDAFKSHFRAFQSNIKMPRPALSYLNKNTSAFALDGNHRLSFAAAIGQSIQCEVLPANLAISIYSRAKDFFDGGYIERPRENIYLGGTIIAESHENDARERFKIIPIDLIQGKSILDVECNIGMNSFFARSAGAASCLGLESSPGLVDLATRFSMFQELYPSVVFQQCNIRDLSTLPTMTYDTAFMRIRRGNRMELDQLLTVVRNNVRSVVILEDEIGVLKDKYVGFFQSGLFTNVKELGRLSRPKSKMRGSQSNTLWFMETA